MASEKPSSSPVDLGSPSIRPPRNFTGNFHRGVSQFTCKIGGRGEFMGIWAHHHPKWDRARKLPNFPWVLRLMRQLRVSGPPWRQLRGKLDIFLGRFSR
jgi:hypothetical protein